jgi:hypothetical protein
MAHGNVHWTANFDEIQDFEGDIRNAFGGAGFMDDGDFAATSHPLGPPKAGLSVELDALADYVASLALSSLPRSPHRSADGAMTASGIAGRAIFHSQGCAACHAPPQFTDSTVGSATLHDVGTLRTSSGQRLGGPLEGIDTPTLLGIWATAPYFHDGSAPTLEGVFRVAGGDILQAEDGTASGGAQIVENYVDLNNDDTVHFRAFAELDNSGATLTLPAVDGGAGGVGALELRFSTAGPSNLVVRVNGVAHPLALPGVGNSPAWRHTHWERVRIEGVALAPGPANTVELTTADPFPQISLDDVLVSTADDLAQAAPHRQVLTLPSADRQALVAYLLQLDGQGDGNPEVLLFADGFESGDASAWSAVVP